VKRSSDGKNRPDGIRLRHVRKDNIGMAIGAASEIRIRGLPPVAQQVKVTILLGLRDGNSFIATRTKNTQIIAMRYLLNHKEPHGGN
jgi:hypothetical protein